MGQVKQVAEAKVDLPRKVRFLFQPSRYKVAYGGRGGGKSWSYARALLVLAMQRRLRVLCARELQNSIQESVHKLLENQIDELGLGAHYQVLQTTIRGRNGSEFIFSGIHANITKIKSMEDVDIAWVEEAERVSDSSWEVLIPTIRKPGSEIWVSFNPHEETDPTYQRFVVNPPPGAVVVEIGWHDNPWLPDELKREKEYLYRVDAEAAEHVWGGKTRHLSNAQVLRGRYVIEGFEPQPEWNGPYYGADWGFATDPTALVKCWVFDRTLYVEHEAYGVGVDIDKTPHLFETVPGSREHVIRADSARPETISYMQQDHEISGKTVKGHPLLVAAVKGPGSVEDGVEHLRSYERIVIHSRCKHAAEEARLWSYKTDKLTGDVLPVLIDKHNHCWDAIRYALEPLISHEQKIVVC